VAVTLRDVAEHAGVSVRTVSNVVNDFAYVSEEMRVKVRAAVEELGYRPNLMARALRQGRSRVIGVGVPELAQPYFSELCGYIVEEAKRRSYTALIEQTGGDPVEERHLMNRPKATHLLDGLIFNPLGLGEEELLDSTTGTSLLLLGERIEGGPFDHVTIDNLAAARSATLHLAQLGRRHVAAIGDLLTPAGRTAHIRTEGYRQALKAAGLRYRKELVVRTSKFSRPEGAAAMEQLLLMRRPPDAVFCYSDVLALGAMRKAFELGIRIPQDVAVVGFDDIEEGRYSTPTLTTIGPDKHAIARFAVEQLLRRLDGNDGPPVTLTADYQLLVRESTAGSCPSK
jgi:LacI family repressor for deo operon, udp, cdd, tsx, nupC, and nupG